MSFTETVKFVKSHVSYNQAIQALYVNASSAVLFNSQLGESFMTTVSVRQECLLSPNLFSLFLEKTMQETLHDNHTSISIGERPTCHLRYADSDLYGR